jgi:hypothetical protein
MLFYCLCRPTVRESIDVQLYHGGSITLEPSVSYVGGTVETFKGWDIDVISSTVVGKFVKSIGYTRYNGLWYRPPSLDNSTTGLKPLNCDGDVNLFCLM